MWPQPEQPTRFLKDGGTPATSVRFVGVWMGIAKGRGGPRAPACPGGGARPGAENAGPRLRRRPGWALALPILGDPGLSEPQPLFL